MVMTESILKVPPLSATQQISPSLSGRKGGRQRGLRQVGHRVPILTGGDSEKKRASEHHVQGIPAEHRHFSLRSGVFPPQKQLTWWETLRQGVAVRDDGENPLQGATLWLPNTLVPTSAHVTAVPGAGGPAGPGRPWRSPREGKGGSPGPGRPWRGKERASGAGRRRQTWAKRDVTHLRDLFAILRVPHRRGLGGDAGQPPPASGECFFFP